MATQAYNTSAPHPSPTGDPALNCRESGPKSRQCRANGLSKASRSAPLRLIDPGIEASPFVENATVRKSAVPKRLYLTPAEIEALIKSAEKRGRWGKRDGLMIYMAARHGFRRAELVELRWQQIDRKAATLLVERFKGGRPSTHYLDTHELRALSRIAKEQGPGCEFVFVSERGTPMTGDGFDKMLRRAAEAIGMGGVHSHLLRHAAGYRLVNEGRDTRSIQGYLGHSAIRHTERYTALDANRFKGW